MSKENEESFRKEAGKWAIAGGIVAGIIGLLKNTQLALLGVVLVASGMMLRKN